MTQPLTTLAMIQATAVVLLTMVQAAIIPGPAVTPVQTIPIIVQDMTITVPPAVIAPRAAAISAQALTSTPEASRLLPALTQMIPLMIPHWTLQACLTPQKQTTQAFSTGHPRAAITNSLSSRPILTFGHTSLSGVSHGLSWLLAWLLWPEPGGSLGGPLLLQW